MTLNFHFGGWYLPTGLVILLAFVLAALLLCVAKELGIESIITRKAVVDVDLFCGFYIVLNHGYDVLNRWLY